MKKTLVSDSIFRSGAPKSTALAALVVLAALLAACAPAGPQASGGVDVSFQLTSPAFTAGGAVPDKYTCKGTGASPALAWNEAPAGTKSFALIMDDPDASTGTFVHWVIYNLPAQARALPEGIAARADLPDGSLSGKNSAARFGYTGPCPPSGTHRYFFRLYALSVVLDLPAGAEKNQLVAAMQDHILATVELMGTFAR